MNKKVIFPIFFAVIMIMFYFMFNGKIKDESRNISKIETEKDTTNESFGNKEVEKSIEEWISFTSEDYGFSFDYPKDYKVEERNPGYFVITTSDENVPQGGISVDARLQDVNSSYENASKDINDNYLVSSTSSLRGIEIYNLEGKEGMLTGVKFIKALIPYKTGVLVLETIDAPVYNLVFEDIVKSIVLGK